MQFGDKNIVTTKTSREENRDDVPSNITPFLPAIGGGGKDSFVSCSTPKERFLGKQ